MSKMSPATLVCIKPTSLSNQINVARATCIHFHFLGLLLTQSGLTNARGACSSLALARGLGAAVLRNTLNHRIRLEPASGSVRVAWRRCEGRGGGAWLLLHPWRGSRPTSPPSTGLPIRGVFLPVQGLHAQLPGSEWTGRSGVKPARCPRGM